METCKICNQNPIEIWDDYGKMIMKIAHTISKKYSKPFDEVLSEGVLGVFKKLPNWDKNRSSLCTFIYLCANGKMLDYCLKPLREIPMDAHCSGKDNLFIQKETQPNWLYNFLGELTEETKQLIKIIFESPEELYEGIKLNKPKTSQKKLRNYMIDVLDWTSEEVDQSFEEIYQCL